MLYSIQISNSIYKRDFCKTQKFSEVFVKIAKKSFLKYLKRPFIIVACCVYLQINVLLSSKCLTFKHFVSLFLGVF